jgi:hypothetical protein
VQRSFKRSDESLQLLNQLRDACAGAFPEHRIVELSRAVSHLHGKAFLRASKELAGCFECDERRLAQLTDQGQRVRLDYDSDQCRELVQEYLEVVFNPRCSSLSRGGLTSSILSRAKLLDREMLETGTISSPKNEQVLRRIFDCCRGFSRQERLTEIRRELQRLKNNNAAQDGQQRDGEGTVATQQTAGNGEVVENLGGTGPADKTLLNQSSVLNVSGPKQIPSPKEVQSTLTEGLAGFAEAVTAYEEVFLTSGKNQEDVTEQRDALEARMILLHDDIERAKDVEGTSELLEQLAKLWERVESPNETSSITGEGDLAIADSPPQGEEKSTTTVVLTLGGNQVPVQLSDESQPAEQISIADPAANAEVDEKLDSLSVPEAVQIEPSATEAPRVAAAEYERAGHTMDHFEHIMRIRPSEESFRDAVEHFTKIEEKAALLGSELPQEFGSEWLVHQREMLNAFSLMADGKKLFPEADVSVAVVQRYKDKLTADIEAVESRLTTAQNRATRPNLAHRSEPVRARDNEVADNALAAFEKLEERFKFVQPVLSVEEQEAYAKAIEDYRHDGKIFDSWLRRPVTRPKNYMERFNADADQSGQVSNPQSPDDAVQTQQVDNTVTPAAVRQPNSPVNEAEVVGKHSSIVTGPGFDHFGESRFFGPNYTTVSTQIISPPEVEQKPAYSGQIEAIEEGMKKVEQKLNLEELNKLQSAVVVLEATIADNRNISDDRRAELTETLTGISKTLDAMQNKLEKKLERERYPLADFDPIAQVAAGLSPLPQWKKNFIEMINESGVEPTERHAALNTFLQFNEKYEEVAVALLFGKSKQASALSGGVDRSAEKLAELKEALDAAMHSKGMNAALGKSVSNFLNSMYWFSQGRFSAAPHAQLDISPPSQSRENPISTDMVDTMKEFPQFYERYRAFELALSQLEKAAPSDMFSGLDQCVEKREDLKQQLNTELASETIAEQSAQVLSNVTSSCEGRYVETLRVLGEAPISVYAHSRLARRHLSELFDESEEFAVDSSQPSLARGSVKASQLDASEFREMFEAFAAQLLAQVLEKRYQELATSAERLNAIEGRVSFAVQQKLETLTDEEEKKKIEATKQECLVALKSLRRVISNEHNQHQAAA